LEADTLEVAVRLLDAPTLTLALALAAGLKLADGEVVLVGTTLGVILGVGVGVGVCACDQQGRRKNGGTSRV